MRGDEAAGTHQVILPCFDGSEWGIEDRARFAAPEYLQTALCSQRSGTRWNVRCACHANVGLFPTLKM
jgi:hypothetical protein